MHPTAWEGRQTHMGRNGMIRYFEANGWAFIVELVVRTLILGKPLLHLLGAFMMRFAFAFMASRLGV